MSKVPPSSESRFSDEVALILAASRASEGTEEAKHFFALIDHHVASGRSREVMIGVAAIAGVALLVQSEALKKTVMHHLDEDVLPLLGKGWYGESWS